MATGTTALDIATAIVASYAALVATLALGFQVFQWLRTWQTRLHVRLERMMMGGAGEAMRPVVLFKITNHSGHPVKVTHVGLGPITRGGPHLFFPQPHGRSAAGTFEVPPRDSVTVWIDPEKLDDGDPRWKTRARVSTSDDRIFKSNKVRVQDLTTDRST